MKKLFTKNYNLVAPSGNNYKWKEAKTSLLCVEKGWHLIKITAKAQNSNQKGSSDDDDLRMALNGYELGKYEIPQGKEHYEGFDSASSWNGATLKGNTKIVYLFFYATQVTDNKLTFYANGEPYLDSIEFYKLDTTEIFDFPELKPNSIEDVDRAGIPWMSFVFIGPAPAEMKIFASAESGKQKGSTDGDNLKILVNGKIIQNENAPTSDKYKNFYFSGDQLNGNTKEFTIAEKDFANLENSVELWYDGNPKLMSVKVKLSDKQNLEDLLGNSLHKKPYYLLFQSASNLAEVANLKYTALFLRNSLKQSPVNLHYNYKHEIVELIKAENCYKSLVDLVKKEIDAGNQNGEIFPGSTPETSIAFSNSTDLYFSIHGIRKIKFTSKKFSANRLIINMRLFDVYDFDPSLGYSLNIPDRIVDIANYAESIGVINNFEISIDIHETI